MTVNKETISIIADRFVVFPPDENHKNYHLIFLDNKKDQIVYIEIESVDKLIDKLREKL